MISKFILAFMAFFAIMNPISNLPAFMALVADDDQKISRRIAAKGVLLAFVIIVIFVLSGHLLFNLFGITLAALKISGGILVGIIGYKMINGIHSPTNKNLEEHKDDPMNVAVSPLAMPFWQVRVLLQLLWVYQVVVYLANSLLYLLLPYYV